MALPGVFEDEERRVIVWLFEDSPVGLRLCFSAQVGYVFWSCLFTFLRDCEIMAERSRVRSSSTESQPKFPECSHFRRRHDNHRRCQQCCLNDGLPLCTQDSPCLVCQDWLPEAWTAQAKAIAQRNSRKAAAGAKAARKESEMLDDSVELHAPSSVPNYCQSVSPKQTTLEEDLEPFLNFSLISCLWFEI